MTAQGFDCEDFIWTDFGESARKSSDTKYSKICKMAGGLRVQDVAGQARHDERSTSRTNKNKVSTRANGCLRQLHDVLSRGSLHYSPGSLRLAT